MTSEQLLQNYNLLPSHLQHEVEDFIGYLKEKWHKSSQTAKPGSEYRQLGLLEGKITMSDDFDEPLEDFKDYM